MMRSPFVFALLFLLPGYQASAQNITVTVGGMDLMFNSVSEVVPADAGEAAVYYDPITGEVTLAVGTGVAAIGLIGDAYDLNNLDDGTDFGAFDQRNSAGIGRFTIPGELPSGEFEIGAILTPGAETPQDFVDAFGALEFRFTVSGSPAISTGFNILPASIPEPGSIAMLSISGLALLGRRRRSTIA